MERTNYPEQIEETALLLGEVQREAAEQRERLAEIESILTLEVAGAKSPEGKPLYSNEAARSAELTLRLRGHEDAAQIRGLLERADDKKTRLLARLERLRGEFKLLLVERQAETAAALGTSAFV
jgi:hypothetical protein